MYGGPAQPTTCLMPLNQGASMNKRTFKPLLPQMTRMTQMGHLRHPRHLRLRSWE
jgi:hypothetical protein